ncbi:MAG: protease SohB [Gammaproteobacteria bacterium]|nr:protease SohB [Gammaproteobacteria bacterium]
MEFLYELGLFIAKGFWVVICIAIVLILLTSMRSRRRPQHEENEGHLLVRHMNEHIREIQRHIDVEAFDPQSSQVRRKSERKRQKAEAKQRKKDAKAAAKSEAAAKPREKGEEESESKDDERRHVFVLTFEVDDIEASRVQFLRKEISAILVRSKKPHEVVVRLKSSGGYVHSYGFAASQLLRIRDAGIKLTVAVDEIAASGGYMMAAVADQIIAGPFAVVGSIGVAAELPNLHRFLKKYDIDYEVLTAGKHKRTLTVFGENTDEHREKFQEEMDQTHELFQDFVSKHRDVVDVPATATGETWYGSKALELKLVDAIQTSDQYVLDACNDAEVYEVQWVHDIPKINQFINRFAALASKVNGWLRHGIRAS